MGMQVPGVTHSLTKDGGADEWQKQLMGKTLGDENNNVVRLLNMISLQSS